MDNLLPLSLSLLYRVFKSQVKPKTKTNMLLHHQHIALWSKNIDKLDHNQIDVSK